MKTERNYLTEPGESVRITVDGPAGVGKEQIMKKILDVLKADGVHFSGERVDPSSRGYAESVIVSSPSRRQLQAAYLEILSGQESATLQGHLSALGYTL